MLGASFIHAAAPMLGASSIHAAASMLGASIIHAAAPMLGASSILQPRRKQCARVFHPPPNLENLGAGGPCP